MYKVFTNKNDEPTKSRVIAVISESIYKHYSAEKLAEGIDMRNPPQPDFVDGKVAITYINKETKEYIYEYKEAPKQLEEVEGKIKSLEEAVDTLILDSLS